MEGATLLPLSRWRAEKVLGQVKTTLLMNHLNRHERFSVQAAASGGEHCIGQDVVGKGCNMKAVKKNPNKTPDTNVFL